MTIVELDGAGWEEPEDFYASLLPELGAPSWHGHTLDALWDSVVGGSINTIDPPFVVRVTGQPSGPINEFLQRLDRMFREARDVGVQVTLHVVE